MVERKQDREDPKAQHHLIGDLGVHHLPGLTQGVRVDVLDAPRQGGRAPVMLAVDDVADPADREPDHRRRAARVDQLPE